MKFFSLATIVAIALFASVDALTVPHDIVTAIGGMFYGLSRFYDSKYMYQGLILGLQ